MPSSAAVPIGGHPRVAVELLLKADGGRCSGRWRANVAAELGARLGRFGVTAVATALAGAALIEDILVPTVTVGGDTRDRGSEVVISTVLCGVVALLAVRHRLGAPAPICAVALLGIASLLTSAWVLASPFVFLLAMYLSGLAGYLATSWRERAGLAVLWLTGSVAAWRTPDRGWAQWSSVVAFTSIAWLIGTLIRSPVLQARSAEERAQHLELDQAAAARQAVADERRRIARELHDIIAHSVSVMTIQAGGVRRLLTPAQTRERETLETVEQTGREALAEMRRLVGLLKDDDGVPSYAPQPGLSTLRR